MKATLNQRQTDTLSRRFRKLQEEATYGELRRLNSELRHLRQQLRHQEDLISNLRQQAMEDNLTGVANRRAFERELDQALSLYRRYQHAGAILMLDMNDFKAINDNLGHLAGDAVLKHIAALLRAHTRDTDVVARLGGDEFAVILREVSNQQAMEKAQRLMYLIANSPCNFHGQDIYTTASIGWCGFSSAKDPAELLERADAHMYKVKQTMIPV